MLLELKGISKGYKKQKKNHNVLDGIDLSLNRGDMLAVMGKSGSGKTTLLNILGGILTPNEGQYFFQEKELEVNNKAEMNQFRKQNISFIVQDFALIHNKTVFQNVELPLVVRDISRQERIKKVKSVLMSLGLEQEINSYPNQLSGGEQQRVSIARAVISEPNIILADEPTGALDEENTEQVLNILSKLSKEGKAIIIVTHDKEVAKRCNRCLLIKGGKFGQTQEA